MFSRRNKKNINNVWLKKKQTNKKKKKKKTKKKKTTKKTKKKKKQQQKKKKKPVLSGAVRKGMNKFRGGNFVNIVYASPLRSWLRL